MSQYQPLFLKYRPQKLEDILGQNSVKETLINAIKNQKIVHAYLLTGPRGSGKTSTARILAKSLNCLNPIDGHSPTVDPCGSCENCVGIANSSCQDVIEIDAASHGGVDDARKLIEKVNFASISGKYRIYIIDEVHMLSPAAFNALLKTIEEPPANVVFILATTEVDKVMKTIVSRCQQLRFKSITIKDCIERLQVVSKREDINISSEALALIAEHSDGAMRDALSLLDQISVFSSHDQAIPADKVLEILGAVPITQLNQLAKSILESKIQELLPILESLYVAGRDPLVICKELANYFVSVLEQIQGPLNEKYDEASALIKERKIENYELVQIIDSLSELEGKFRQTTNSKNLLRAWLIKICYRADMFVVRDLLARVEALEAGAPVKVQRKVEIPSRHCETDESQAKQSKPAQKWIATSPASQVPRDDKPSPEPIKVTSGTENSNGASFLDYLSPGSRGMFVSSNARLISINGAIALIQMPTKFKFLKSKLESRKDELLQAISKQEGQDVSSLLIEVVEEFLPQNLEPSVQSTQSSSPKLDEVVSAGINFFNGKEIAN